MSRQVSWVKTCMLCGREFSGHFNAKFCGEECRQQFKRSYEKTWKLSHKKPPPEPEVFEPFPPDIDRDGFGYWLSGFADGEATFGLKTSLLKDRVRSLPTHFAHFRITLRDDDAGVLRMIQSYWGCGSFHLSENARRRFVNAKPTAIFSVQKVSDLVQTVIAHFDRYPLHAKKRNDLAIWRRGVQLMARVQGRPQLGRFGSVGGLLPKWTKSDRDEFLSISQELSSQRRYST